jgi:hypothetical protein
VTASRNLRTLPVLAALFLLPLILAFFTYYGTGWRPAGHVNHGSLITPARPLPTVPLPRVSLDAPGAAAGSAGEEAPPPALRNRWSLVYVGDGACDADCRAALYVMRQTRLSLGNDMPRVQRVFLVTSGCCARDLLAHEHAGLLVLDAAGAGAAPLLQAFPEAGHAHTLFVVDPLGNLMMSYDVRNDPRGLREDLKKLLRLSHIG